MPLFFLSRLGLRLLTGSLGRLDSHYYTSDRVCCYVGCKKMPLLDNTNLSCAFKYALKSYKLGWSIRLGGFLSASKTSLLNIISGQPLVLDGGKVHNIQV